MEDNLFSSLFGNACPIVLPCHQAVCPLIFPEVCPSAVPSSPVLLEFLMDFIWTEWKNQDGKKIPFTCYENWLNSKNTARIITPGMENCVGEFNNFLFSLASWFLNRQIAEANPSTGILLQKVTIWGCGREPKVLN